MKPHGLKGEDPKPGQRGHGYLRLGSDRLWHFCKVTGQTCKRYPSVWLLPSLHFLVLLSLGIWGIVSVSDSVRHARETTAQNAAQGLGEAFQLMVQAGVGHSASISAKVHLQPEWPGISKQHLVNAFHERISPWVGKGPPPLALQQLSLAPYGRMNSSYPEGSTLRGTNSSSRDNSSSLLFPDGFDFLGDRLWRPVSLKTIQGSAGSDVTFLPGELGEATDTSVASSSNARLFVVWRDVVRPFNSSRSSFGIPWEPTNCAACAQQLLPGGGNITFWGLSVSVHETDTSMLARAAGSLAAEYRFRMVQVRSEGTEEAQEVELAHSTKLPRSPIKVSLQWWLPAGLGGSSFYMYIEPEGNWTVVWRWPLIAVVIVLSFLVAGLQFGMQLSRRQHQMLLKVMLPQKVIDRLRSKGRFLQEAQIIESGTTADKVLSIMADLLEGRVPSVEDVVMVRTAILHSWDIYQPIALDEQIAASDMDQDVANNMLRLLGNVKGKVMSAIANTAAAARQRRMSYGPLNSQPSTSSFTDVLLANGSVYNGGGSQRVDPFANLSGALMHIMTATAAGNVSTPGAINGGSVTALGFTAGGGAGGSQPQVPQLVAQLQSHSTAALANALVAGGSLRKAGTGDFLAPSGGTSSAGVRAGPGMSSPTVLSSPHLLIEATRSVDRRHTCQDIGAVGDGLSPRSSTPLATVPPTVTGATSTTGGTGTPPVQSQEAGRGLVSGPTMGVQSLPSLPAQHDKAPISVDDLAMFEAGQGQSTPEMSGGAPLSGQQGANALLTSNSSIAAGSDAPPTPLRGPSGAQQFLPGPAAAAIGAHASTGTVTSGPNGVGGMAGGLAAAASAGGGLFGSMLSAFSPRREPKGAAGASNLGPRADSGLDRLRRNVSQPRDNAASVAAAAAASSSVTGSGSHVFSRPSAVSAPHAVVGPAPSAPSLSAHQHQQQILEQEPLQPAPPPPLMDDVEMVLASTDSWEFDAWKLHDVTRGHPLSTLAYFLLHETHLIDKFRLKRPALARYLRAIEEGYRDCPYHNRTHASDVLQTMHVIVTRSGLLPHYADPLTHLACYLAAVVHDFEHQGLTNDFLINTSDVIALTYNDKAPLENHHIAAACMLMRHGDHNFTPHLNKEEQEKLRKMMIELVLGTDMKQHFSIVSHFSTVHRLTGLGGGAGSGAAAIAALERTDAAAAAAAAGSPTGARSLIHSGSRQTRTVVPEGGSHNGATGGAVGGPGAAAGATAETPLTPIDEAERLLSLQMALKCADLGHIAESLPVHLRWVSRLEEEFFMQGDKERSLGLPISPLFDRNKPGITKSQVGFFDFVVVPLFNNFCSVFKGTEPMFRIILSNYRHWVQQQQLQQQQQSSAAAGGEGQGAADGGPNSAAHANNATGSAGASKPGSSMNAGGGGAGANTGGAAGGLGATSGEGTANGGGTGGLGAGVGPGAGAGLGAMGRNGSQRLAFSSKLMTSVKRMSLDIRR